MVAVNATVNRASVKALSSLLARVEREMPRRVATETRRAALYLCKSLAARTKVAPKRMRSGEYSVARSDDEPRYITNKNGRLLRRWELTRRLGTPDEYTRKYYVNSAAVKSKDGRHMVGANKAAERRELVKVHGGIPNRGLAKKSWGWVAKKIYNAAAEDLSWKLGKHTVRDPRRAVEGLFRKAGADSFARLSNRLDYIRDAIHPGAVDDALRSAANRLRHNIEHHIERAAK